MKHASASKRNYRDSSGDMTTVRGVGGWRFAVFSGKPVEAESGLDDAHDASDRRRYVALHGLVPQGLLEGVKPRALEVLQVLKGSRRRNSNANALSVVGTPREMLWPPASVAQTVGTSPWPTWPARSAHTRRPAARTPSRHSSLAYPLAGGAGRTVSIRVSGSLWTMPASASGNGSAIPTGPPTWSMRGTPRLRWIVPDRCRCGTWR